MRRLDPATDFTPCCRRTLTRPPDATTSSAPASSRPTAASPWAPPSRPPPPTTPASSTSACSSGRYRIPLFHRLASMRLRSTPAGHTSYSSFNGSCAGPGRRQTAHSSSPRLTSLHCTPHSLLYFACSFRLFNCTPFHIHQEVVAVVVFTNELASPSVTPYEYVEI
jgi:hypothetical protein